MHALINAPKSISVPGRHQKNACEMFNFTKATGYAELMWL